ncbi:MAG: DUF4125 family protein [Lachnospiraceae bacterium]|nr:DUF4125 family protein [Lachnospiraceae bacterium]
MDIEKILAEYDAMFSVNKPAEILSFLLQKVDMARERHDAAALLILLNETIGFCRDASFKEEGIRACLELESLLHDMDMDGTIEAATTFLNLGNAYRGFGMYEESAKRYSICEEMFENMLVPGDFLFSGLYNNRGLLYQEMKDWDAAVEEFKKAIEIADIYPEHRIESATSRANLAAAIIEGKPEARQEAASVLKEACERFEAEGGDDFHYSAALAALGSLYFYEESFDKSAACFKKAMDVLYKGTGESESYRRVKENYELARRRLQDKKILSRTVKNAEDFYEKYLYPLIKEKCPAALERVAIGYSGEGSEHFGYDDETSTDHDFVKGCVIWLTEETAALYGPELSKLYDDAYMACFKEEPDLSLMRQGVMLVDDYFERLTGLMNVSSRTDGGGLDEALYGLDEEQLAGIAAAVNGRLFMDSDGTLTRIREYFIKGMPEEFRRRKLATLLHIFSQAGQYNYMRCIKRGDRLTAGLYEARAAESALKLVHYLNRRYPPYIKWLKRSAKELDAAAVVADMLEAVSDMTESSDKALAFDIIAAHILEELKSQDLIADYDKADPFADRYVAETAGLGGRKMTKDELIEKIVLEEWKQFDKTINEGGRADCQDNWETFSVMRKSQYLVWDESLLRSFYKDLTSGRNLITEKYGRMMESTAPARYEEIKDNFPVLSEERRQLQEGIIAVQVGMMESFAARFPKMAGNARSIHTSEDTEFDTSYETYLRGEISTYSDETLLGYGRLLAAFAKDGRNIAYEIMNNTARLLGYAGVEDAEEKL